MKINYEVSNISSFTFEYPFYRIFTKDGKTYLCNFPLISLEEKLGDDFLRIHRSLLVNTKRIREINKHYGSRFVVKMDDSSQTKLLTGRGYCEQVRRLMEI